MKKSLKNYEIENIVTTLSHNDSFLKNVSIKLPQEFRQAIRINLKRFTERLSIYEEGRKELIQNYIASGHAFANNDGSVKFEETYVKTAMYELNELANVNNELDIEVVDKEVLEKISKMDISMAEDDIIHIFEAEEK